MRNTCFLCVIVGMTFASSAEVTIPHVFGDNMVLQQGRLSGALDVLEKEKIGS